MNLENLNLVELNAQEEKEIDGGLLVETLLTIGGAIIYNWSDIKKGFNDGWNSI
jgi:hypothetical protein